MFVFSLFLKENNIEYIYFFQKKSNKNNFLKFKGILFLFSTIFFKKNILTIIFFLPFYYIFFLKGTEKTSMKYILLSVSEIKFIFKEIFFPNTNFNFSSMENYFSRFFLNPLENFFKKMYSDSSFRNNFFLKTYLFSLFYFILFIDKTYFNISDNRTVAFKTIVFFIFSSSIIGFLEKHILFFVSNYYIILQKKLIESFSKLKDKKNNNFEWLILFFLDFFENNLFFSSLLNITVKTIFFLIKIFYLFNLVRIFDSINILIGFFLFGFLNLILNLVLI